MWLDLTTFRVLKTVGRYAEKLAYKTKTELFQDCITVAPIMVKMEDNDLWLMQRFFLFFFPEIQNPLRYFLLYKYYLQKHLCNFNFFKLGFSKGIWNNFSVCKDVMSS